MMALTDVTAGSVATVERGTDVPMLEVIGLTKSYGDNTIGGAGPKATAGADGPVLAIDDVTFEVQRGEMFTLLGPSGCGKTTTLRSIAGLETPNLGRIAVGGAPLFDSSVRLNVPINRRGLGMVFQSYAIWPHMTVRENVAFPLRVVKRKERLSRKEIDENVERVLAVTGLEGYASRQATKLSGGQQQRLALARALVAKPDLLLLDEPLSNLDAKLRESMRFELKRLQRDLGVTSIYVTHDQTEAMALSSRIAVMNQGKVVQVARPRDIYQRPADRFVAEFIGTTNLVTGTVQSSGAEGTVVAVGGVTLRTATSGAFGVGEEITISVRPENLAISTYEREVDGENVMLGTVRTRAFMGDSVEHEILIGDTLLRAKCNPAISLAEGTEVFVGVSSENLTVVGY